LYIYLELEEEEDEEEDLDEANSLNTGATAAAAGNGGAKNDKHPKKLFKVSASTEGSCKITISAHTPQPGVNNTAAANAGGGGGGTSHGGGGERKRKNKDKDFASPSSESKIQVHSGLYLPPSAVAGGDAEGLEKCAVSIQFDPNTKKLWQELHYPYGNYTSFFR
jgi:hypothetical protein